MSHPAFPSDPPLGSKLSSSMLLLALLVALQCAAAASPPPQVSAGRLPPGPLLRRPSMPAARPPPPPPRRPPPQSPPRHPPPPSSGTTLQPLLLLQGRFFPGPSPGSLYAQLPQLMSWSASSATFAFTGSASVTVTMNGSLAALPEADRPLAEAKGGFPWCFFQFALDGVPVATRDTSPSRPLLTWRLYGLSPSAQHTLTITKLTEPKFGAAWISAVSLNAGGTFVPPAAPAPLLSNRRMLFLGDSFTTGYANLGNASCSKPNNANWQNSLLAYPALVAKTFQADYQLLGWSGGGLHVYTGMSKLFLSEALRKQSNPISSELFVRADALDPASRFGLNSWVPQVVVLAAGTNDLINSTLSAMGQVVNGPYGLPSLDEWLARHVAFMAQIRQAYPQAAIITMVWPTEVLMAGVRTLQQAATYLQYMAAAYSRLQASGFTNHYLLQLTGEQLSSSGWCGQHPDTAAHTQVAAQLTQFISSTVPGFAGAASG